ncbi:MAG: hypothetical protein KJN71_01510 [Acidimicrobiia bacterium]|nr:hypothetical protein [Acidimicrobiia bacterium]NNC74780.1 hypothetical protein [Acidimicrobiia bacterium]
MDDLIKQITEKTGISMDQAKGAIEQVMNFLGDKLPGPIASQVKGFLGDDDGGDDGGDEGGGLMGKLGGLLGN